MSKTGTTSLANALDILGFKTKDNMGVTRYARGDLGSVDLDVIESYDAHTDTPIPSFYRELDAKFPGSKFVLTVRERDAWLKSCKKQFTQRFADVQTEAHKQLFIDLYGTDVFDEQRFASGYERFVDAARNYFNDRPRDLLTIDITAGDGWEELCRFLGRSVPDIPFPRANVTQITWMNVEDLVAIAKLGGRELMQRYDARSVYREGGGLARALQRLPERVSSLIGRDGVAVALQAANKVVRGGLSRLAPNIPVLSRAEVAVPYAERRFWNHFWLIDALDGQDAFASRNGRFSIDIALIEDARPLYGVVYEPVADSVYYGMVGKGSFRRTQSDPPVRLVPRRRESPGLRAPRVPSVALADSQSLAICAAIDGEAKFDRVLQGSMEWSTAAAHAILRAAGMHVRDCDSSRELEYNKPNLSNMALRIE